MTSEFRVASRQAPGGAVLELEGDVTAPAEPELMAAYRAAIEAGARRIVLDCGRVDYINSSGIAIVIAMVGEARRAGRQIAAARLSPHFRKVFEIVGLTKYVRLTDSVEQALQDE